MMYILGHSHAINPIHAVSAEPIGLTHYNWDDAARPPVFEDIRCKDELGITQPVKYYLISGRQNMHAAVQPAADERKINITPNLAELIRSVPNIPETKLLCFINGNEHSSLSMIEHEIPYDFVRTGDTVTSAAPPLPIIPLPLICERIQAESRGTYGMLEALRMMLPQVKIYLFTPPPPIPSEGQIMANPEAFGEIFRTKKVARAGLRLKYYQEYARALQEVAGRLGIICVPVPAEACASGGFLAEPYWQAATHGNMQYAEQVAGQIRGLSQ